MKRGWPVALVAAAILGAVAGELLCRWPAFRDLAGRVTSRGRLVSMVNGKGLYEADLGGEQQLGASDAVLAENLRRVSANHAIDSSRVEEPFTSLLDQFADREKFDAALRSAGLSDSILREKIEEQLRERDWLEKQMATGARPVTEEECRNFYFAHPELFAQPIRYRASHVFLAAHAETPPDVIEEKEAAIAMLATRLNQGETLSQLAAEASEDEASKPRSGDLGYFSETRVPDEFMAEIRKLPAGQTSQPFRSHLGFHIVQLAEIKPARALTFEEAKIEISVAIANERRARRAEEIAARLSRPSDNEISAFASP